MNQTTADQSHASPSPELLDLLVHEHVTQRLPRLDRLWRYFRNPLSGADDGDASHYQLGQEQGLPARLRHRTAAGDRPMRERVVENDVAWRVHTLVDFMFGRQITIQSLAPQRDRAQWIDRFLRAVFEQQGGVSFFQDLALLGSVYGHIDVLVHIDAPSTPTNVDDPREAAQRFRLELIEAPRAVPVLAPDDYRQLEAYVLHVRQQTNEVTPSPLLARMRNRMFGTHTSARRAFVERTHVWSAESVREYRAAPGSQGEHRKLVSEQVNRLGRIPVVHIQNLAQPYFYEGLSEVEPLIPLQDELNTRLSDRANRVTFQCFKMYLGKGIEQFIERPIGPGQMWSTDNPDASIQEFGGDASNPSEEAHIREIREAMDKASGVTPVAAGIIGGRVGNLTSAVALRTVLMGLIAKTQKKRITYGAGIERLCELLLHAADVHGLMPNEPDDRRVRIDWPHPLPLSEHEQLQNARLKLDLGVSQHQVLTELGYGECAHTD
ncbi:MAG: phage portal protein [Phycisphaeraceae bacterium]